MMSRGVESLEFNSLSRLETVSLNKKRLKGSECGDTKVTCDLSIPCFFTTAFLLLPF